MRLAVALSMLFGFVALYALLWRWVAIPLPAPRRLDVRRSVPKLILHLSWLVPFAALAPSILIWMLAELAIGEVELVLPVVAGWLLYISCGISAIAGFLLWVEYRLHGRQGVILRLTEEGLSMPARGLVTPVPWKDVIPSHGIGMPAVNQSLFFGVHLTMKLDPKARVAGMLPDRWASWRMGGKWFMFNFPETLDARGGDIVRLIQAYREQDKARQGW